MVGVGENDLLAWELRGADKRRSEKQRAREDKQEERSPRSRGLGDDSWTVSCSSGAAGSHGIPSMWALLLSVCC